MIAAAEQVWLNKLAQISGRSEEDLRRRYGRDLAEWFANGDSAESCAESVMEDDARDTGNEADLMRGLEENAMDEGKPKSFDDVRDGLEALTLIAECARLGRVARELGKIVRMLDVGPTEEISKCMEAASRRAKRLEKVTNAAAEISETDYEAHVLALGAEPSARLKLASHLACDAVDLIADFRQECGGSDA